MKKFLLFMILLLLPGVVYGFSMLFLLEEEGAGSGVQNLKIAGVGYNVSYSPDGTWVYTVSNSMGAGEVIEWAEE